jgi:hypothetical protein
LVNRRIFVDLRTFRRAGLKPAAGEFERVIAIVLSDAEDVASWRRDGGEQSDIGKRQVALTIFQPRLDLRVTLDQSR